MSNTRLIGVFQSEDIAIKEIQRLLMDGYHEGDIHVIAKNSVERPFDGNTIAIEGELSEDQLWFQRFMTLMTKRDTVRSTLEAAEIPEVDINVYEREIENGAICVYVDENNGSVIASGSTIVEEVDKNLGPQPVDPGYIIEQEDVFENDHSHQNQAERYKADEWREEEHSHLDDDISMLADMENEDDGLPKHLERRD